MKLSHINYYENLPFNWELCHIKDIALFVKRGKSPSYCEESNGILVLAQKCNQWDGIYLEKALKTSKKYLVKYTWDKISKPGDIIINSTGGGTVGRIGYLTEEILNNIILLPDSHITTIRVGKKMSSKYVYYFFTNPLFQNNVESYCEGSTNQIELYSKVINGLFFPLPPLSSQIKIVNKIDKLFTLIKN